MDENALRLKYNLSIEGLKSLYRKLTEAGHLKPEFQPTRRRLNLKEILADITRGMSQSDLMRKYDLSAEMLRNVSRKLLAARGVRSASDDPDTIITDAPDLVATREIMRHEVDFNLPVYDTSRPDIHGQVRDVSEQGISLAGIAAKEGDVKTLVVLDDDFGEFSSFELEGCCRWCFTDPKDETCLTGFSINEISEDDLVELRKLVRLLTVGG